MSVVVLCSIIGIIFSTSLIPKCPAQGYFSISSGMIGMTCICLSNSAFTITVCVLLFSCCKGASNTSLASSKLPIVAEIPQTEIFEFDDFFFDEYQQFY